MALYKQQKSLKPPIENIKVILWLKENLFSSIFNTILTILSLYLIYKIIPPVLNWALFNANFNFAEFSIFGFEFGAPMANNENCGREAACWPYIYEKFYMYIYGFYPHEESWRVNIVFLMTALIFFIFRLFKKYKHKNKAIFTIIVLFIISSFYLLKGGIFGLTEVQTHYWGGLMLTLIIASFGIIVSFPIGVILALGRSSNLRIIKLISISFIELIRGVPLITLLFMASFLLPLFFESGVNFDKLLRALIAITIFQAALFAEVIRGGLQAIPRGQYEAAESIGLNYFQKNVLIILPQALKISIPNIVGSSISLFKDTTLVLIIGLMDMLAMVGMTSSDPYWLARETEGYIFVAAVMWIFLYSMSRYSKNLELRFNTDNKN